MQASRGGAMRTSTRHSMKRAITGVRAVPSGRMVKLSAAAADAPVMLEVKDLCAKISGTEQQILNGVNLTVKEGEVHAIMGKNGSGKSTLSKVLVGHPDYEVTSGSATYKGKDLFELEPEERSHAGLFLSFQSPIEVPGVSNVDFLRMACNARRKALDQSELDPLEFYAHIMPKLELLNMDPTFLNRNVNEGFSGGEKKRNEILQAVNALKRDDSGVLMVTHYKRLLDYIKPDFVHIMQTGEIVKTGDMTLVDQLELDGYASVQSV